MSDLDELCHTLRAFAERYIAIGDREEEKCGPVGAHLEIARREVAKELLALLPPGEPREARS